MIGNNPLWKHGSYKHMTQLLFIWLVSNPLNAGVSLVIILYAPIRNKKVKCIFIYMIQFYKFMILII